MEQTNRKAVLQEIDRSAAMRIRYQAIRRIMAEEGCIYPIARAQLNRQKDTMRKEVAQISQKYGVTRAAAFYLLQDELNQREKSGNDTEVISED
jgi:hemerythrin-like domain-containing protein